MEALIVFCVITPSSAAVLLVNIHHLFKYCLSSLEAVTYLLDIQHHIQHNNLIKGSKQNMEEKLSR